MNAVGSRLLWALGAILAAAMLASLVLGIIWGLAVIVAGLTLLLVHHVGNLAALARWVATVDAPVPNGTGAWEDIFAELHRYSKQRTFEQAALADALQRFRDACEALPDGVVMLNGRNQIEWSNGKAQAYLGLDAQRDVGQPIFNFIRQPEFLAYLAAGQVDAPLALSAKTDAERVLSLQLIPYGDEQKLLLSRDITELERVDTVRRDFVANVSHELKTPLTVVVGFLETLQELKPNAKETARYLTLMSEQTRSMQRLVEDLLVLSALESTENALREEPIRIRALLESVCAEARSLSNGRHDIALEMEGDCIVLGAEAELRSAFSNLVSNAVRYTAPGGHIRLSWQVVDGHGVYAVADSGIGIEAEHIPRLTERFYRVDRGRSRATGGTGLGLAIVKHVLMRHQATLKITSEPGKGSCFSVHFPPSRLLSQEQDDSVQLAASR